jgi:hypothetical protein
LLETLDVTPWLENKVLAALLFLIDGFHLFHLYNVVL